MPARPTISAVTRRVLEDLQRLNVRLPAGQAIPVIHLVDVYSIAKHPTSTTTPIEMWQDSAAVHPPCLPASSEELLVLLARPAERTYERFWSTDPSFSVLGGRVPGRSIRVNRFGQPIPVLPCWGARGGLSLGSTSIRPSAPGW